MPQNKLLKPQQGLLNRNRLGLLGNARQQVNSLLNYKPESMPASMGDVAQFGIQMSPFVGDALAVEHAGKDWNQGNYGSSIFNAATALPVIGDAAMVAKVGVPTLFGMGGLLGQMARRSGKAPTTPFNRMQGVIGYHGSPHKFDQFDMSKIGTGEGAQAYGHGLYFAENPRVAMDYKESLGGYSVNGKPLSDDLNIELGSYGGDVNALLDKRKEQLSKWVNSGVRDSKGIIPGLKKDIRQLEALKSKNVVSNGTLYKVDIPDEYADNFLDWDKGISEQPKSVQQALKDAGISGYYEGHELTGEGIYQMLRDKGMGQVEASNKLNELGIKGIRYLDQGSRQAGEGTRNFVVFDDKIIKMLEKE